MSASKKTKSKLSSGKPASKALKKPAVTKSSPSSKSSTVKKASAKAAASKSTTTKSSKTTPALKAPVKASAKKALSPVIEKKLSKTEEQTVADKKRSALSLAMKEGIENDESENDEEEEFDPEAFFAASGGKGLFRAHIMRKERVDLSISIRYRFLNGPLVFNSELVNLSKGGLCLKTSKDIKVKTILKIEIPLPHTSELFTVQAEIVWCDALSEIKGEKGFYFAGLKFMQMSLAKQTVINNFIQQRRDEIVLAKIGLDKFTDSVPVAGLD